MKNPKLETSRIARRILAASALIMCFAFTLVPARADAQKFLLVSFQENVTSFDGTNGTLDGKATFAGAFNDKCTRHEDFHVVSADKDGNPNIIGTSTFIGTNPADTLTTSFTGTIYFSADPNISYVEGDETITGGTGAYADARGKGTFEATQDFAGSPSQVVGVFEATSHKVIRPVTRTLSVPTKAARD